MTMWHGGEVWLGTGQLLRDQMRRKDSLHPRGAHRHCRGASSRTKEQPKWPDAQEQRLLPLPGHQDKGFSVPTVTKQFRHSRQDPRDTEYHNQNNCSLLERNQLTDWSGCSPFRIFRNSRGRRRFPCQNIACQEQSSNLLTRNDFDKHKNIGVT
jgi:hypothetical protein